MRGKYSLTKFANFSLLCYARKLLPFLRPKVVAIFVRNKIMIAPEIYLFHVVFINKKSNAQQIPGFRCFALRIFLTSSCKNLHRSH